MTEAQGTTATAADAKAKKKETEVESVKMADGRTVDFAGKKRLLKESTVAEDNKSVEVRLDFRNGQTRKITLNANSPLLFRFAGHGVEQKLGDETAGLEDVDDATEAVDDLIARLAKGEWTSRVEGGGFAGSSVLAQALVEYSGKTLDEVRAFLKDMKQAEKMGLRQDPDIKPIVERIEAEKAAKASKDSKVDTAALKSKLGAIGKAA